MKLSNYISNCRSPRIILNKGIKRFVSCGRCPDCMNRKARTLEKLLNVEISSHKYAYFFTLTYDEDNVPKMYVNQDVGGIYYVDCTKRPDKKGNFQPIAEFGTRIADCSAEYIQDERFQLFHQKANKIHDSYTPSRKDFFRKHIVLRYLRKKDTQNFLKLLRYNIRKVSDAKVRYFITGEYGPETFRPHYHGILFFDSVQLVPFIEKLLVHSWKFGAVREPSFVNSAADCSNYVSTYCNSFATLPRYLAVDNVKPFSSHSLYFGGQVNKEIRDCIYENPLLSTANFDLTTSIGTLYYSPTSANQRLLFPRCYNFDYQTDSDLYQLYTCYSKYSTLIGTTSVAEIARTLLYENHKHSHFLRRLDLFDLSTYLKHGRYFRDSPEFLVLDDGEYYRFLDQIKKQFPDLYDKDEYFWTKIYSRLCSALYLSKHFVSFCCEHVSPREAIRIIKDHYRRSDYSKLCSQYTYMEEYFDLYRDSDYSLFYPLSYSNEQYQQIYNSSNYIKNINIVKDNEYREKVKHKTQNDANQYFV